MIDISYLIADLDKILGSNMFLKDAQDAENLKGSIHTAFNQIQDEVDYLKETASAGMNQAFTNMDELEKTKRALIDYLKNQIELNRTLLSDLGEWY